MICAKHPDGRIVLMASEYNLKPMIFYPKSDNWESAKISGEELNDFIQLNDTVLVKLLLVDAKNFAEANPEFKINT